MASTISQVGVYIVPFIIVCEMSIGMIYDIFGRKRPLAMSYLLVSIGLFVLINGHDVYPWYLLAKFFSVFENITAGVPFVPDLLHEESHGMANAVKAMCIAVADVCSTSLLGLSSFKFFDDIYIFFFVLILNSSVAILIIFGMKDVILEKDENRRDSTSKLQRAGIVCNQAAYLLKTEPYFIFAIIGGMYTITTSALGNNSTIIAIADAFKLQGSSDWESDSKWYFFKLKLTQSFLILPFMALYGHLSKKYVVTHLLFVSMVG